MGVIAAQLHHSDTRMTEKHYAHLAPSYVTDTVRAMLPAFGIIEESNVVLINPETNWKAPTAAGCTPQPGLFALPYGA
jgi:hypothetical protein